MTKRIPPSYDRPGTVQQALDLALRASHGGRYEEAESRAADILKADRGNALAAQVLASALIGQGRAAEAIAPLRQAARRGEDAATQTLLGHALAGAGQAEEALAALRRACALRPAFTPAFLELGSQLSAVGRQDEAMAVFEEGLCLAPGAPGLLLALGNLHLQRNDRVAARRLFGEAHLVEPNRIGGLAGLARVSALEGDYATAADCYRRALILQPADVMLRIELAKCLLEIGALDQGESMLRSAAGASPLAAAHGAVALAASAHGHLFLRTSRALEFLRRGAPAPA